MTQTTKCESREPKSLNSTQYFEPQTSFHPVFNYGPQFLAPERLYCDSETLRVSNCHFFECKNKNLTLKTRGNFKALHLQSTDEEARGSKVTHPGSQAATGQHRLFIFLIN